MVYRTVLQYQLVEKIGSGGMGEVYKVQDTRLNRFVAMKVLPPGMSSDPDRRRRFIQEAQAASALNHPNIITIYDIVSDGDTQYMVMEYVAGRTLVDLIPKDGLRVPQVIQYAAQMADALCAAHAAGIIHRDLKPANVMVTGSGLVKLLDFGLAKLTDPAAGQDTAETATRLDAPLTVEGLMMGTVNYMSPEQAEGRRLDARSDIFSFGAVLYEMLTGRHAFGGTSALSILSSVLRDEVPPIAQLTPDVPFELEEIVIRCLRKNADQRFQSMQEVQEALAALKRQLDSGALYHRPGVNTLAPMPPAQRPASTAWAVGAFSALLLIAIAGGGYWWVAHRESVSSAVQKQSQSSIPPQSPDATLTNDSIIAMVVGKVSPPVIVSQIRASKTNFNLSASEVIRLSKAGVPASVIEAMLNPRAKQDPFSTAAASPNDTVANPAPGAAGASSAPQITSGPATQAVLGEGVPIRLTLAEDVPSDATAGDPLHFNVANDVRVDGTVVIARGAAATGTIVDGPKRKILGLGGKMTFRLAGVPAVDGQAVKLRATAIRRDDGPSKRTLEPGAKQPKGVAAAAGTEYMGYVDSPKTVSAHEPRHQ